MNITRDLRNKEKAIKRGLTSKPKVSYPAIEQKELNKITFLKILQKFTLQGEEMTSVLNMQEYSNFIDLIGNVAGEEISGIVKVRDNTTGWDVPLEDFIMLADTVKYDIESVIPAECLKKHRDVWEKKLPEMLARLRKQDAKLLAGSIEDEEIKNTPTEELQGLAAIQRQEKISARL